MKEATFDPARECKLYFRCNRTGSKDIVVSYSDGSPYSFIYEEFEANIYKYEGERKVLIPLTVSYNSNRLTISISKSQSNINQGEYYFELYNAYTDQTWIADICRFHNGRFDGVSNDSATLTVNTQGEVLSLTLEATPNNVIINIDGGTPTSIYTGIPNIDGGTP
jgi:hypothetical protein